MLQDQRPGKNGQTTTQEFARSAYMGAEYLGREVNVCRAAYRLALWVLRLGM